MRSGPASASRRSSCRSAIGPRAERSAGSSTAPASFATSVARSGPGHPDSVQSMILAIDQGTTGTTCIVFDEQGRPRGRAYSEFEQHFPRPGWVEHDAAEIWEVTRKVAIGALADAGVQGSELSGIGITNQRETVVAWDPTTGEPGHPPPLLRGAPPPPPRAH